MYTIETHYDLKALSAMGRALRKTIRKKHSKRSHFLGVLAVILGLVLLLVNGFSGGKSLITAAAVLVIVVALIFEDFLNGYIAQKCGLPGMEYAVTTFLEDNYQTVTEMAESTFFYRTILSFIRYKDYFVFVFSPNHGQIFELNTLKGGSVEEFVAFIEKKAGTHLKIIK